MNQSASFARRQGKEYAVYSTKVMEHFQHPRNVGEIEDADGTGKVGNPICGDIMQLQIKVQDGRITDARFKTFGCGAAIATSSMVTEIVKGRTIEEALKITNDTVAEALGGLPSIKMHCSVLAEEALQSAIQDYLSKQGKSLDDYGISVRGRREVAHAHF